MLILYKPRTNRRKILYKGRNEQAEDVYVGENEDGEVEESELAGLGLRAEGELTNPPGAASSSSVKPNAVAKNLDA